METEEDDFLLDDENVLLNKERYYFGSKAKDKFWGLYKSGRTFKDNRNEEIKDPRFAYIKSCNDMKMLPKAGMVIRSEPTKHISYANFGLLNKNSIAVAESLKRYPLEVESIDFTGNGLKAPEWVMLVEALEAHYSTLQHLNLSGNKIGHEGAISLSNGVSKMLQLENLNIDGNLLGDESVNEILKAAIGLQKLKLLNLSNNWLGHQIKDSELVDTLSQIINNTSLLELNLSWNNFRGEAAEQLILAFQENFNVK